MTSEPSETHIKPIDTKPDYSFPKQFRLLQSSDYRRVYKAGMRVSGACFRAFCCARAEGAGPRVGLTVPKALGKAVDRNRIKRRMREAVRHEVRELGPEWDIVFNPRQTVLTVPMTDLQREVRRVFRRCGAC